MADTRCAKGDCVPVLCFRRQKIALLFALPSSRSSLPFEVLEWLTARSRGVTPLGGGSSQRPACRLALAPGRKP